MSDKNSYEQVRSFKLSSFIQKSESLTSIPTSSLLAIARIQAEFKAVLLAAKPDARLPF